MLGGMIFGPISWASSAHFLGKYQSYVKESSQITGKVVSKWQEEGFRSYSFYAKIKCVYLDTVSYSEVEVQAPLWEHLYITQQVDLLHDPQKKVPIKIKMENEGRFLPPILKKGWGKWTTIISYLLLVFQIVYKRKINKSLNLNPGKPPAS